MNKRREISSNPDIQYRIFLHKLKNISIHCHDSYELLYVLNGSATVRIEEKNYILKEDDLILANPNQLHEIHSDDCVMIVLQINSDVILAEFNKSISPFFNCNSSTSKNKVNFRNIKVLIAKLIKLSSQEQVHTTMIAKAFLYELIFELYNNFQTPGKSSITNSPQSNNRISNILEYINHHYAEDITLTHLSKKEFLSASYLSRYFEKKIGQRFKTYLTSVRLNHAFNDLCTTHLTISDISNKNGFPNPRSFVAAFKNKYNCLPSQYRKDNGLPIQYEDPKDEPLEYQKIPQSNYLSKLSQYLDDEFSVQPEKIIHSDRIVVPTIDVRTNQRRLFHNFKDMLTMVNAKDIRTRKTQKMLESIQNDIGFKYLQIFGFLGNDVKDFFLGKTDEDRFNYDLTDEIIDFLQSINLKPMFKLGFDYRDFNIMTNMLRHESPTKKTLHKWSHIVESFLAHLIQRYSLSEVLTWRFTLQEEANSINIPIAKANEARYYQIYSSTYHVIKSINPNLPFGPSAVLPYMIEDPSIPESFFNYVTENNCTPDFLSLKYYSVNFNPKSSNQPLISLSMEVDGLSSFIRLFKNKLENAMLSHIPIYLTQWNSTISNRDLLNDTCFKSCYLVKNIVENYDELEAFGYWTLSDQNSLHTPSKDLFHGGLGLLTKNGIKKAAYNSLSILSKLGSHLLTKDIGYLVSKSDNSYQVLVYNYQHYSELYGMGENYDIGPLNRYAPFAYARSKQFAFTLEKVHDIKYILAEYIISKDHGSSYDIWANNFPVPLTSDEDLEALKGLSEPLLSKRYVQANNKQLDLSISVAPHEVKLITLSPII